MQHNKNFHMEKQRKMQVNNLKGLQHEPGHMTKNWEMNVIKITKLR